MQRRERVSPEQRTAVAVRVARGCGLSHQDASALWDEAEALRKLLVDRTAENHVLRERTRQLSHDLNNARQVIEGMMPGPYQNRVG